MGDILKSICDIVVETGKLITGNEKNLEIEAKPGTANYVTVYDSIVQETLISKLKELLPEAEFVGEEDGYSTYRRTEEYTFFIDPIDGTTNFINDFKASAICVGMAQNGVLEIGVVYNPFRKELFYAQRGKGAYLNEHKLNIENKGLKEGILCIDTAPYNPEIRHVVFEQIEKLSYQSMDVRCVGSAALSICYQACGRAVGYLSPRLCVWDYAAASVILEEAGGKLTTRNGKNPDFGNYIPIIAGTCNGVDEILQIIAE